MYKGLLLTDLDGTFLNPTGGINKANLEVLEKLQENGIARAVCTGRTLDSAREVVPCNLPFDYLIFSSGAGICEFSNNKILCHNALFNDDIISLTEFLCSNSVDFNVHFPIPENHRFYWFSKGEKSPDLISRLHYLKKYAIEGSKQLISEMKSATQMLVIVPDEKLSLIDDIKARYSHLSIVRATSPITPNYSWIEIFPGEVTKGKGARWLADFLGVDQKNTMSIGNDYNDIHMLEWTSTSYIMDNSPKELKDKYIVCPSNKDDGFAFAVNQWLFNSFGIR